MPSNRRSTVRCTRTKPRSCCVTMPRPPSRGVSAPAAPFTTDTSMCISPIHSGTYNRTPGVDRVGSRKRCAQTFALDERCSRALRRVTPRGRLFGVTLSLAHSDRVVLIGGPAQKDPDREFYFRLITGGLTSFTMTRNCSNCSSAVGLAPTNAFITVYTIKYILDGACSVGRRQA